MKRITIIIALTFALPVLAYSQEPPKGRPDGRTPSPDVKDRQAKPVTQEMWKEYQTLVTTGAGEEALQAWARSNKLKIVSRQRNRIMVVPEQGLQSPTNQETAGPCDAKGCSTGHGYYEVKNYGGKVIGHRTFTCKASSCVWIKNDKGNWERLCGGWKCRNDVGGTIK